MILIVDLQLSTRMLPTQAVLLNYGMIREEGPTAVDLCHLAIGQAKTVAMLLFFYEKC